MYALNPAWPKKILWLSKLPMWLIRVYHDAIVQISYIGDCNRAYFPSKLELGPARKEGDKLLISRYTLQSLGS
jgi:hypothetical protein